VSEATLTGRSEKITANGFKATMARFANQRRLLDVERFLKRENFIGIHGNFI
jgi:hypothetical protein